ncbi:tRNA (adenosine(37)-N6)-threonylcarbamoyltransferase complex ATPase subunit type 1 TsaE [Alcaligenaceae bacterium A4P071]|nr:tRNA (adenosine(37)-N6)-threonylcarbamoyltransferase complex ATPase subunit type 1 TsaE [Alcaligenaceae bacterium A4P071]
MSAPIPSRVLQTVRSYLPDEAATGALAAAIAPCMAPHLRETSPLPDEAASTMPPPPGALLQGGRIHLVGDLGAGKTAFARALLRAVGVTGRIKSPSYALLESYKVFNLYCYHLDFYRFSDPREWLDAGFRDVLREDALVLIEWPQRAGDLLPAPDLTIALDYAEPGRDATLSATTERGQIWLNAIVPLLPPPRAATPPRAGG